MYPLKYNAYRIQSEYYELAWPQRWIFKNKSQGGFQFEFVSISRVINHMTFILKKSFTRFALQSECCNFNQWEHSIYNRSLGLIYNQFGIIQVLQRSPIPQTNNWPGTFFAVSYSKPALMWKSVKVRSRIHLSRTDI